MSGIVGIFQRSSRPVDRDVLTALLARVAFRGGDEMSVWTEGSVGLACALRQSTPEVGEGEEVDAGAGLRLVFDGRLDNREDLIPQLSSPFPLPQLGERVRVRGASEGLDRASDSALVLRAYGRWGDECPIRLIGDFAFALWDAQRRRLFCARDALGVRPFYYQCDQDAFRFASEIHAIFADASVRRAPNPGMIGEYLAAKIRSRRETLYQGLYRLPPAHALTVSADGFNEWQYWSPDPEFELQYQRDEEYAEHFRELFQRAVAARLRSKRPVAAYLSGGLDSSSVVGVAQSIARERGRPLYATYSLVFPGESWDESRFAQDVVDQWGQPAHFVAPRVPTVDDYVAHTLDYGDVPDHPATEPLIMPLLTEARRRGCGALLTGWGGDQYFSSGLLQYADFLRARELRKLVAQVWLDARAEDVDWSLALAARCAVVPLLAPRLRAALRGVLGHRAVPAWLDPVFVGRYDLLDRIYAEPAHRCGPSAARNDLVRLCSSGMEALQLERLDRAAARAGLEHRHPFYDRRLVEFAIALPETQRRRPHQKYVLRRALGDLLPERVRQRLTKGDFEFTYDRAFDVVGGVRAFERTALESTGWVRPERLRALAGWVAKLRRKDDKRYNDHMYPLWLAFGVDFWYRKVFQEGAVS